MVCVLRASAGGGGSVTEPMSSLQKWKFETENKVLIVIFVLTVILKVLFALVSTQHNSFFLHIDKCRFNKTSSF